MEKHEKLSLYNDLYHRRKYRIKEELDKLPKGTSEKIKKSFPDYLGVERQTVSKYMNYSKEDTEIRQDIPGIALAKIAKALGVTMESLINVEIPDFEIEKKKRIDFGIC